jgi:hypothetical protein
MPILTPITNNFFINLINRLGIRPPPIEGFVISNVVQPVSIVDSDIALNAISTSQLLDVPFSTGLQVAQAANTILADTGQQPAGTYVLKILGSAFESTVNIRHAVQRRDAANAVTVWEQRFYGDATVPAQYDQTLRINLLANERVRVVQIHVASATCENEANIWLTPA